MDRILSFRTIKQAGRTVARWALGPVHALAVITLMAVAVPVGVGMPWGGDTTAVQAASSATFSVAAPGAAQPVGTPFTATVNLSGVTFDANSPAWGGYDVELSYDSSLLTVSSVAPTLCPSGQWSAGASSPGYVVTGCFSQQSTVTSGVLETITFTCTGSGVSALTLVPRPGESYLGSSLFDTFAADMPTTLNSGSVSCGSPPTGTATNTPTPTNTPTQTPTFTPSPTFTPGPPPATGCTTNVGGPPTLGVEPDCDLDINFPLFWGDGCVDSEDANPNYPWDFYSVPIPALYAAANPPTVFRNNVVTVTDAQAVFAYFKAAAVAGAPVYEQDLNQNGVRDGWEYDRSQDAFGNLGPPNGVVTAGDAQSAFAQFVRGVRCSSGYNLAKPSCTTNVGGPPTLGVGRDCDFQPAYPGVLGDGCVDTEDPNTADPWGFYSVPVPSLLSNPTTHRDNVVTVGDAQSVFSYFRVGAMVGSQAYQQDLNQNGVRDGWEYDRSINNFGQIGPPDGVISAADAQAAFAQFASTVSCTSGYNMQNQ